nr:hypothetical protein [Paenibacillus roseus]
MRNIRKPTLYYGHGSCVRANWNDWIVTSKTGNPLSFDSAIMFILKNPMRYGGKLLKILRLFVISLANWERHSAVPSSVIVSSSFVILKDKLQ